MLVIAISTGVRLYVPDEASFFCVAWTRHVLMVFEHDFLWGPRGIVLALWWKQEVELVFRVEYFLWDCELVQVGVKEFVSVFLSQLKSVSLLPHESLGVGF